MERGLKPLITKVEKRFKEELRGFRSGIEPADRADRVLGFIVSSDFEGVDRRQRQVRLKEILANALTQRELHDVGPILTMTPSEASIELNGVPRAKQVFSAKSMNTLISKINRVLGDALKGYEADLSRGEIADRVFGHVVSTSFNRIADHSKRYAKVQKILEGALTPEEVAHLGPILTLMPSEAAIMEAAA